MWARLLPGAPGEVLLETSGGGSTTRHATPARVAWHRHKHLLGHGRLGLSPVHRGRCRWGAIDLDAHEPDAAPRLDDAVAIADVLVAVGLTPYLERSRGGRGYHVWLFVDAPGVHVEQMHQLLVTAARAAGPAATAPETFPSSPTGTSRKIYLPGFRGAPLLDADLNPVHLERIELDDPALVVAAVRPARCPPPSGTPVPWPPRYMETPAGGSGTRQPLAEFGGLAWVGRDGLWNARRGARNQIAGRVARRIVETGGTWERFVQWDQDNDPPLATDEPQRLRAWWSSASRKSKTRADDDRQ